MNYEKEIPFGAFNSELMEATYFIPQGYHAVIDGDKVIIKKGEEPVSNDIELAEDYAYLTGQEKIIAKAIKWLKDNTDRYLYNTGGYEEYIPKCGGKMFEDFKKAMEE